MSELVYRAKASLEGVDPYTPWDVEPFGDEGFGPYFGVYAADSLHAECRNEATAKFIAAARQLVPELISEIEALEWTLAKVTASWKRLLAAGATNE